MTRDNKSGADVFKKTILVFFLAVLLAGPVRQVRAEEPVVLQAIERRQDLASTVLTLRFSELPGYEVNSGGQRVDINLLGDVVADDLGPLPEDERIIKVLLAGHRKGLLVSFLFRSPPARVSLEKNGAKKELEVDCLWDEPHGARPGMAMYIKGMPVPRKDGTASISGLNSRFSRDWNTLYAYSSPLLLKIPLSVHVPVRIPLPEGPWYSGVRDALVAARAGRWETVARLLAGERTGEDASVGFLTLSAFAALHAGDYSRAVLEAEQLVKAGVPEVLGEYGTYVNALALAAKGAYLEAAMVLRSRPDVARRGGGMAPYWRLLLGELAIEKGQPEQAGQYLTEGPEYWPEVLRRAMLVRRGDLLADSGKGEAAQVSYGAAGNLQGFPSSLWRRAELLFASGEYGRCAPLYAQLKDLVADDAIRGLVQWREALAAVYSGRLEDGEFLLKMVVQDYYETEAFDRARLSLLDLGHRGMLDSEWNLAGVSYARVARHSRVRELRQEAMLKQGLALHQEGNDRQGVTVLEQLLHEFINGSLRPDAQVLLADILPGVVESLIEAGETLQALVLVERNRDLLINSRMQPGFLKKLADGFAGLTLYTRAARVLQYMIDAGAPAARKSVFVPLARLFVRLDEPGRLERLVREYESGYPQGAERALLRGMWAEALMNAGDVEGAVQALPLETALGRTDLEQLLVRIHWKAGNMPVVAACLKNIDLAKNMHAFKSELLLRGEALMAMERYGEALPLFEALGGDAEVSARAKFRLAGTLLALGREKQGRTLLEELARDRGAGHWTALAGETLKDLELSARFN